MSRMLFRLGRAAARHPWRVIAAWVMVAVAVVALRSAVGGTTTDDFKLPGTESQAAVDLLKSRFPAQAGASGQVVFHAVPANDGSIETANPTLADAEATAKIAATAERLRGSSDVVGVSEPQLAPDGRTAFVTVHFASATLAKADARAVLRIVESERTPSMQIEAGGTIAKVADEIKGGEGIGLVVAVLVLLFAFGSLIAVGIPIGTALFGLFIGLGGVGIMAGFVDVPTVSPLLATMIGLGVGIDYALFVITRHRAFLHEGWSVVDAAGRANATAGQAVLFAGVTVVIAISGLVMAGIPSIGTMGFAAGIVVAVSMAAAVTLLPAFLGLAGHCVDRLRIGRHRAAELPAERTIAGRWAHHVGRRPWRYALASLVVLGALGAPVLAMRVGFADDGSDASSTTQRRAYDLLANAFGPGFNGPLTVVIDGPASDATLQSVSATIATDPAVAGVLPPVRNSAGDTAVITVFPVAAPQHQDTERLVHHLRSAVLPDATTGTTNRAYVAGWTAAGIDISERLATRLPWFIGAVVTLSFLLLLVVFRSILVPLKAALMNLLSIGASYGVVVAVFQWGWLRQLVGVERTIPIFPFAPMIMFAILFGLSMDYEVFLLSRVREEFQRSGDSHRSVVDGLASTARVITSAALIMISVFLAFVASTDVSIKIFGVGLATAVLIDATLVRMVLVPATMALLGDANWWLPRWLDRLLPHVDVEGGSSLDELGSAEAPALAPAG